MAWRRRRLVNHSPAMRSRSAATLEPSRRASASSAILVADATRQLYTSPLDMHYSVVHLREPVNAANWIRQPSTDV